MSEIAHNDYNLNLPRYIDTSAPEDRQDLEAHLRGGIPNADIDALAPFWEVLPSLRSQLFEPSARSGYSGLSVNPDTVLAVINESVEFGAFRLSAKKAFDAWETRVRPRMLALDQSVRPKAFASRLANELLESFAATPLLDPYAIFQGFMEYWDLTMSDDVHLVVNEGWAVAAAPVKLLPKSKDRVDFTVEGGKYHSDLLPADLLIRAALPDHVRVLNEAVDQLSDVEAELDDLLSEHGQEGGLLEDAVGEKGRFTVMAVEGRNVELRASLAAAKFPEEFASVTAALKALDRAIEEKVAVERELGVPGGALAHVSGAKGTFTKKAVADRLKSLGDTDNAETRVLARVEDALSEVSTKKADLKALRTALEVLVDTAPAPDDEFNEERTMLGRLQEVLTRESEFRSAVKEARDDLDEALAGQYGALTPDAVAELTADSKWLSAVSGVIEDNLGVLARSLGERVRQVALRYAETLPELVTVSVQLQARVDEDLKLMGMTW